MGTYTSAIQKLYVSYFSRPADAGGLAFWEAQAQKNPAALTKLAQAFAESPEYQAQMQGKSTAQMVDEVYVHLFGRHAEQGGVQYWGQLLENKAISVANMVTQIAAGAQGSDASAFAAKLKAAETFTSALELLGKDMYDSKLARQILETVVSEKDLQTAFGKGGLADQALLKLQGIAVGEPHPDAQNDNLVRFVSTQDGIQIIVGNKPVQGIAVGEPHPGQGVAVGEPHPGQGIAIGEPHPGSQNLGNNGASTDNVVRFVNTPDGIQIVIGNKPAQGIAVGEPHPDSQKLSTPGDDNVAHFVSTPDGMQIVLIGSSPDAGGTLIG
ncbi:DUF4214 domain-containing protein [Massilia sp. W12]|uniref:DUF4214 domain-containing protein n=1 Tax=Massilia sp. W12 TaxID=3126507 RepID=UPI0030D02052